MAVTIRLLEAIAVIAPFTYRPADRAALRRQAQMIERGSQAAIASSSAVLASKGCSTPS